MSDRDRRLFGQYLGFEPFNSQRKLVDLYALVEAHTFAAKPPKVGWEAALQAAGIIPSQAPKLLTFLQQRLDQFLGMQQVLAAPHRHLGYNLEAYNQLKVEYATTEKKHRQLHKRLHADRLSTEHLQQMLDLEHFVIKARIAAMAPVDGSYFGEMHRLIDLQHLTFKLKYACAAINEAQLLKLPFPGVPVQQALDALARWEGEMPSITLAYATLLPLLAEPAATPGRHEAALALLVAHEPHIAREDSFDLFNYLLNLCYRGLDAGDPGAEALVVTIYRHLAAAELLAVDGEIPPRVFKNIVSVNCRQANFQWCRDFIQANAARLPREDQGMLPRFCHGLVHFYEGDHAQSAQAFRHIMQLDPDDHFWGFESRNLLLKSYFHRYADLSMAEHEDLYRLVDSFRMYVRRNGKLDSYHQQCYLNFIQYFGQMLRHMDQHGVGAAFPPELRRTVESEKMVTNKAWLLGVLMEK